MTITETTQAIETTDVTIVTRFAIEAAHQEALMEKNYRECRVYGMGRR